MTILDVNKRCQQIVDKNKNTEITNSPVAEVNFATRTTKILPTNESQCRPLSKLPPERQREVWQLSIQKSSGKVPSARLIRETIKEIESVDDLNQVARDLKPTNQEVNYIAGVGVEYTVRLDAKTYNRLQCYQDKIGAATKCGVIARLLDAIVE